MPAEYEENYVDNAELDGAYMLYVNEKEGEERKNAFFTFLSILSKRMYEGGLVPAAFTDVENSLISSINPETLKAGDQITIEKPVRLRMDTVTAPDGSIWVPLFINDRAINRGVTANIHMPVPIMDIFKMGIESEDVEGIVVNPFGKPTTFKKSVLKAFMVVYEDFKADMDAKKAAEGGKA